MLADIVLAARLHVAHYFEPRDIPPPAVVLAIIEHEARGNPRLCKDESDGSSSRGLMQINRKHSRCNPVDDARFAADYDPAGNVRHGVWLLALQAKWHREAGHNTHDVLVHYAGRGPSARRFAEEIRALAAAIESEGP